jgi:hypothetical protein
MCYALYSEKSTEHINQCSILCQLMSQHICTLLPDTDWTILVHPLQIKKYPSERTRFTLSPLPRYHFAQLWDATGEAT